jgi:aspartate aminotransferase
MVAAYRKRHDFLVSALNDVRGFECRPGEGTFYAFPRVRGALEALGMDSDIELAQFLLNEADVAVVPGTAFGAPGHIRLSFACSTAELEESLRRIRRVVPA